MLNDIDDQANIGVLAVIFAIDDACDVAIIHVHAVISHHSLSSQMIPDLLTSSKHSPTIGREQHVHYIKLSI